MFENAYSMCQSFKPKGSITDDEWQELQGLQVTSGTRRNSVRKRDRKEGEREVFFFGKRRRRKVNE